MQPRHPRARASTCRSRYSRAHGRGCMQPRASACEPMPEHGLARAGMGLSRLHVRVRMLNPPLRAPLPPRPAPCLSPPRPSPPRPSPPRPAPRRWIDVDNPSRIDMLEVRCLGVLVSWCLGATFGCGAGWRALSAPAPPAVQVVVMLCCRVQTQPPASPPDDARGAGRWCATGRLASTRALYRCTAGM